MDDLRPRAGPGVETRDSFLIIGGCGDFKIASLGVDEVRLPVVVMMELEATPVISEAVEVCGLAGALSNVVGDVT